MKPLTYDDLADMYKIRTGGNARICPMQRIVEWALTQPDVDVDAEDNVCLCTPRSNAHNGESHD